MRRSTNFLIYLVIALLVFIVYVPALQNEYVSWDDPSYVFENHHIQTIDAAFIRWALFDFNVANWHPLTWLSYALDYAFWGLSPLGYHLTNIILHSINVFLLVLLIVRLLEMAQKRMASTANSLSSDSLRIAAVMTGLLFGLHPLRVESVAWISERKDLLCGSFFLLSILVYSKYVGSEHNRTAEKRLVTRFFHKHYLLSMTFFALALLSKPMAITLPVVLLILDWYPFGRIASLRTFFIAFIEKIPFLAFSFASSILTILAAQATAPLPSLELFPLSTRLLVATQSLIIYTWKIIWPMHLVPFYPYPANPSILSLEFFIPAVLVVGISITCLIIAKKHKLWLTTWGYYVITITPVIGIIQVGAQSRADRYTYLPSISLFLLIGLGMAWIWEKISVSKRHALSYKIVSTAITILIFISLSILTVKQIGIWKNDLNLWTYVIEKEPKVYFAYSNRAMINRKLGELDKAIDDLNKAIELTQNDDIVFINRGMIFLQVGQRQRALSDFEKACELGNDFGCKMIQYYKPGS